MADPEFLAETKKRRYELEPVSGEEVKRWQRGAGAACGCYRPDEKVDREVNRTLERLNQLNDWN
jgi:hypothetical protein